MGLRRKKLVACLVVLSGALLFCNVATARIGALYLSWLPKYSDALAVCRVVSTKTDHEGYIGNLPVLDKVAEMEVLRAWPANAQGLAPGDRIHPSFRQIDLSKQSWMTDRTPQYPRFAESSCYLITLKREGSEWQLAQEEDRGWVWEAQDRALTDFHATTPVEFILGELAATISYANYPTMYQLVDSLDDVTYWEPGTRETLFDLVEHHVGDPKRWVDIATACYPRLPWRSEDLPRARELTLDDLKEDRVNNYIGLLALKHLPPGDVRRQLTLNSIEHVETHWYDTADAIRRYFPDDAEMLGLIEERLRRDEPVALDVANYLVRSREHPLAELAISKALEELRRKDAIERGVLAPAVQLIFRHGDDKTYGALLDAIKESQTSDHLRFVALFSPCKDDRNKRVLPILRIAIQQDWEYGGTRMDERATMALQWNIQRYFGCRPDVPPEERRHAVELAKKWLAENDEIPPPPPEDPTRTGFPPWVTGWGSR